MLAFYEAFLNFNTQILDERNNGFVYRIAKLYYFSKM